MARTNEKTPWVNMDSIRVRKPRPQAPWPTHEEIVKHRREVVKTLVSHGEDALRGGTKMFGAVDCVYFVRLDSTDAYKIGHTFHLRSRLSSLSTGIPVPLRPVSWVSFFDEDILGTAEWRAHDLADFHGERVKGEWFNLAEGSVRVIVDQLIEGLRDEVMGVSYDGSFAQ